MHFTVSALSECVDPVDWIQWCEPNCVDLPVHDLPAPEELHELLVLAVLEADLITQHLRGVDQECGHDESLAWQNASLIDNAAGYCASGSVHPSLGEPEPWGGLWDSPTVLLTLLYVMGCTGSNVILTPQKWLSLCRVGIMCELGVWKQG